MAERTERFTGAELEALCQEAGLAALREDPAAERVCACNFVEALRAIRPALTPEVLEAYAAWDHT